MADDIYLGFRSNPDSLGTTPIDWTANIGANDLPNGTKAVFFDADGTCSATPQAGGAAVAGIPCLKGQPLPFIPGRITLMTTATKCFVVTWMSHRNTYRYPDRRQAGGTGGSPPVSNYELREDGSRELREDGTFELRE